MPRNSATEPEHEGPDHGAPPPDGMPLATDDARGAADRDLPVKRKGGIPRDHLDDHAVSVVRRLQSFDHEAYLVGGCVRDLLSGLEPKDFDVATDARPNRIKRLFRNARIIGRRFRLAHIRFGPDHVVETSTFRGPPERLAAAATREDPPAEGAPAGDADEKARALAREAAAGIPDVALDRREARAARRAREARLSPENVFGTAPEDARRRDFTINALFYDPIRDEILDWVGGLDDLDARVVRSIGDPDTRLKEDPVRIIRAVHHAERMGFRLEEALEASIRAQASELANASQARLYIELMKVLSRACAYRSLHRLHVLGALRAWLPEMADHLETPAAWPVADGGTHEEAQLGEPRDLPPAHATWNLLGAADRWGMAAHEAEDALVLAPLLGTWILDTWRASGAQGYPAFAECFEETIRPLALRMSMPRRTTSRLRDLLWLYLGMGREPADRRAAKVVRRPTFHLALAYLRLDLMARDRSLERHRAWAAYAERHGRGGAETRRRPEGRAGSGGAADDGQRPGGRRREEAGRGGRKRGGRRRSRGPRQGIGREADAWAPAPEPEEGGAPPPDTPPTGGGGENA